MRDAAVRFSVPCPPYLPDADGPFDFSMLSGCLQSSDTSALAPMASKVWLITGAASGFGRSLLSSVLARGDRVIATSKSLEPIQDLDGTSENLRLIQLDVTTGEELIRCKMQEAAGRIDVLVNNAGSCHLGLLEEGGSALLRKQYETNVFGLLDVTSACLPYMRAQNEGTIVVIGSRSAWTCETVGLGAQSHACRRSTSHCA
ncbi:hypothetical protein C8R47DRAFT_717143 [Mycena vitilis]|nr:hypothetical protein C8R47DRAFT_717143 [Mycena vitilis]